MTANRPSAFNIQDWLEFRNGRASCPCCEAEKGFLNSNLSLVPGSNGAYKCHAGHTSAEIRAVLGAPLPNRPSSLSDSLPSLGTRSPQLVPELPNRDFTVDESYVRRSLERLVHHGGSPQQKALAWLEGRAFTREMIEHYQLGMEQLTLKPDKNNPEKKEIYWAIAIFIPVPGRTGRYYKKMRVAPGSRAMNVLITSADGVNLASRRQSGSRTSPPVPLKHGLQRASGMRCAWVG